MRRAIGGISDSVEQMPLAERVFDGRGGAKVFLPAFFGPINCEQILVEGVTFERSLFWNIVPVYCRNIIIRGVTVNSHGHGRTDGIDIDSSTDALIEYTTLDCGDDCFTLKAGRGNDGVDRARPTENVVIRHCRVKRGVGGLTIGSETAGGIRNVYACDVVMEAPRYPIYMKTRRPRGGGCENITLERLHIKSCAGTAIQFDMLGSRRWVGSLADRLPARPVGKLTPKFADITFKDVTIDSCRTLISAQLDNKMGAKDVRRDWWDADAEFSTETRYQQVKFQWSNKATYEGDYIWMRTPEFILTEAEALCQLGRDAEAQDVLNNFMKSYRDENYNCTKTGKSIQKVLGRDAETGSLLEEILVQRRIELWGEFGRIFDIRRLKQGFRRSEAMGWTTEALVAGFKTDDPESWCWVMNIPQAEFDANRALNPAEDQNPTD